MSSFPKDILDLAMAEKEVDLTTFGRKTGKPSRRTIWVWGDGQRLYVRSGQGLGRDWPQNLLANNRGILHVAGRDVPIRVRHVSDPAESRAGAAMIHEKYQNGSKASGEGEELTPGEQATFEILPA
jgi:deazaflavin-dependent oxidoreductase (nitroreductase family)